MDYTDSVVTMFFAFLGILTIAMLGMLTLSGLIYLSGKLLWRNLMNTYSVFEIQRALTNYKKKEKKCD